MKLLCSVASQAQIETSLGAPKGDREASKSVGFSGWNVSLPPAAAAACKRARTVAQIPKAARCISWCTQRTHAVHTVVSAQRRCCRPMPPAHDDIAPLASAHRGSCRQRYTDSEVRCTAGLLCPRVAATLLTQQVRAGTTRAMDLRACIPAQRQGRCLVQVSWVYPGCLLTCRAARVSLLSRNAERITYSTTQLSKASICSPT